MVVPLFFTVAEVSRMLGRVSEAFIRAELRRGRFFPISGGEIDATTVVRVGGSDMISLLGLNWYLRTHCAWPCQAGAVAELAQSFNDAPPAVELPAGVPARSAGELKRKVTHG